MNRFRLLIVLWFLLAVAQTAVADQAPVSVPSVLQRLFPNSILEWIQESATLPPSRFSQQSFGLMAQREPLPTDRKEVSQAKLHRFFVIDDSGSMAIDNRIGIVRDELTKQLQQLPPSRDFPVSFVTFGSSAKSAKTFYDLKSAIEFLGRLNASSGGTSIAAGLAEANAALKNSIKVPSVWVMLFSDGDDSNMAGILAEEAKLDALFSDRSQQGLAQTVVFCKRWGGSNALLQQQIEKRGHARLIDAGEALLKTVTMEPKVTVDAVRWLKDKPNWVEVDFTPSITVRGDASSRAWPPVRWQCDSRDAEGDTNVEVTPGASALPRRTLRLPVPPDAAGKPFFPISFSIDEPNSQQTAAGLTIPLLAGSSLQVPVRLPDAKLRNIIKLACDLSQPPSWSDPLQQKATFPIKLTFDVKAVDQSSMDRSSTFRVIPNSATAIIAGDPVIKLPGPGTYTVLLTLELTPKQVVADLKKQRFAFQLTLRPEQVPPNLTYEPALLRIQQDNLAPPTPVRTRIEPRVQSTSTPTWADLSKGLASYSANVAFTVHGPIPPGTQVTIVAPAAVKQFDFGPKTLRTGGQTIKIDILSEVSPAPTMNALQLQVVPPANRGAVEFECKQPIRLALRGPRPLKLLVAQDGQLLSELASSAADNDDAVAILFQPIVSGVKQRQVVGTLRAAIQSSTLSLEASTSDSLELFAPHSVRVKLPKNDLPFFTDSAVVGDLDFQPTPSTPAVIGSRYLATITVQAPFKRLMVILAISLSIVLTVVLLGWMIVKLRHRDV